MHTWCINLNFSVTVLTFALKVKDFGNSWNCARAVRLTAVCSFLEFTGSAVSVWSHLAINR